MNDFHHFPSEWNHIKKIYEAPGYRLKAVHHLNTLVAKKENYVNETIKKCSFTALKVIKRRQPEKQNERIKKRLFETIRTEKRKKMENDVNASMMHQHHQHV